MLDKTDIAILSLLQNNIEWSLQHIAEQVNLTTTPCWKRIKRLEQAGYVREKVALLDPQKLGLDLIAFVQLKTQHHSQAWYDTLVAKVNDFAAVMECYRMAGEYDYMLKVLVRDMVSFDRFYKALVNEVPGLSDVTSNFAMEQIKYTTQVPLSSLEK